MGRHLILSGRLDTSGEPSGGEACGNDLLGPSLEEKKWRKMCDRLGKGAFSYLCFLNVIHNPKTGNIQQMCSKKIIEKMYFLYIVLFYK